MRMRAKLNAFGICIRHLFQEQQSEQVTYTGETGWSEQAYFAELDKEHARWANGFHYYEYLIESLHCIDSVRLLPLYSLASAQILSGERVDIGLRHDVDADPVAALKCARFLAFHGICGTFFLLPTSGYYGRYVGDCFVRNSRVIDWIEALSVAGCEIGLKNDRLLGIGQPGYKGIEVLKGELDWLRGLGVKIRGTAAQVADRSCATENFEIFEGMELPLREGVAGHAAGMTGCLIPADLGLDFNFALTGRNEWAAWGHLEGETICETNANLDRVLELARFLPKGSRALVTIPTEYVRDLA